MSFQSEGRRQEPLKPLRRQRLRVSSACEVCRLRKIKCDGGRPACTRCQIRGKSCTYSQGSVPRELQTKKATPVSQKLGSPTQHSTPGLPSPPALRDHSPEVSSTSATAIGTPTTSHDSESDSEQNRVCYTAHARFAGEVVAAIDVRAGLTPAATSNLVPFVDAPLFGDLDLHTPQTGFGYTLPPREHADELVRIYWKYLDPVEPILDYERFSQDYEAVYTGSGAFLHADRDIWLSIFYVVIASAVQRKESIPMQKRDAEGNHYFQRAWALLRPEVILWKPGSIELIQSLMLMSRYLHCTNNQQKTWMTTGLAVRIAQGMCCHLSESSGSKEASRDTKLKQELWARCVSLDRCVSWSLGRTSVPSLIPLPSKGYPLAESGNSQHDSAHAETIKRRLELHEIGNQIQLAQTQTRNGFVASLGLPRLYQQNDYVAVAVQLDSSLNRWEDSLPSDWHVKNLPNVADRASRLEGYLHQIRLLHSRIFLFRPILARFYSTKPQPAASQPIPRTSSLSDRLLKDSAAMCVEAAQNVTALIIETLSPRAESIGLLPWWYRVYYLHIAGTIFLAAMFVSDLFTPAVSDSWNSVLSALRAHAHLSTYVQQCILTFETLSTRILATRFPKPNPYSNGDTFHEGTSNFTFDDVFEDVGFDFDTFVFGMEDIPEG